MACTGIGDFGEQEVSRTCFFNLHTEFSALLRIKVGHASAKEMSYTCPVSAALRARCQFPCR